jgi:DnaJ-class molecular chaperone
MTADGEIRYLVINKVNQILEIARSLDPCAVRDDSCIMNVYELLGVDRDADIEDIKQAYRTLAKALHPDVNAGDEEASERFKEITAAYNLLADRNKRIEYDLTDALRGSPNRNPDAQPWEKDGAWFDLELDEVTGERIIDLFGDVAGTRMGRVKGVAATSLWMKGQDVAERLRITEKEARAGICKLVTTMTGLTVAVDVPAGTVSGERITLEGFGIEGFGGGPPGDLNVRIELVPDPAIGAT